MFDFMKAGVRQAIIPFVAIILLASAAHGAEKRFTRAQIAEDFETFLGFVKATHPDVTASADLARLESMAAQARQAFRDGMTLREAWMAMALVNPVFKDGHVGLRRPVDAISEHLGRGGRLFPVPVVIGETGSVRVARTVSAELGVSTGDEILSINGQPADDIIARLKPRMSGETERLGLLVLERYFPEFLWVIQGDTNRYVVRLRNSRGARSVELPAVLGAEAAGNDDPFVYKTLNPATAYLNVRSFDLKLKDRFAAFLTHAFTDIRNAGAQTLVIDLRENGGGAHDVSDLLLAYLTDRPYSAISRVTARVTTQNIGRLPGAKLGAVVTLPFREVVTPPAAYPLRFKGAVYAIVGKLTYSQAIAVATTLQDHGIATIVGEETEGAANQTGQVTIKRLPNTNVEALAPIYIFTRASGDTSRRGVVPEIEIKHDPLEPMRSVRTLLEILSARQSHRP